MKNRGQIASKSFVVINWLLGIVLAAVGLMSLAGVAGDKPFAQNGTIDLRFANFEAGPPIALRGDWEFYWDQLLTPQELQLRYQAPVNFYPLPAGWQGGKSGESELGQFGKATYKLRVLLPPSTRQVGIHLPYFYGWAALYIDGVKVRDLGRYDINNATTDSAGSRTQIIQQTSGDTLEIVIQTANFTATQGGILQDMVIGGADMMAKRQAYRIGFDMFLISALLFTAFYHGWMFVFRRSEDSNLWFGLFSLLIAVRTVYVGEGQLSAVYLDLPGLWSWRMELITYYLAIPVLAKFISRMYPLDTKAWLVFFAAAFCLPISLLTVLTKPPVFAYGRMIIQAMNLYLVYEYALAIARAVVRRRDGAILFMGGFFVIAGLSVLEIVALNMGIDIPRMSPIGMYLFVGFQSIQLARRFNAAFVAVESRERDIRKLNQELQEQESTKLELAKVSAERRMLQLSLAEAQNVYRSLGHGVEGIPGVEISSDYRAAEVSGGDWMGVNFDEVEQRLYIVLADVTGHDLLSALVSIATAGGFKGAISAIKASHGHVEMAFVLRVLADVLNSAVLDTGDKGQRLMTAALFAIDIATGDVAYLNAGHTPLLHISGNTIAPVIPSASPLGLHTEMRHGCVEFKLRSGDAVFLHTDGLFDNAGPTGDRIKLRELRPILLNTKSADEVHDQLRLITETKWGQVKLKDDFSYVYLKWGSQQVDATIETSA